jgi:hypothetical protein
VCPPTKGHRVRTMFIVYWVVILVGLGGSIVVGLAH